MLSPVFISANSIQQKRAEVTCLLPHRDAGEKDPEGRLCTVSSSAHKLCTCCHRTSVACTITQDVCVSVCVDTVFKR